jgi:hypothetical protein
MKSNHRPEYVVGTDNEHQTQWRDQALAHLTANMHTCVCIFQNANNTKIESLYYQ